MVQILSEDPGSPWFKPQFLDHKMLSFSHPQPSPFIGNMERITHLIALANMTEQCEEYLRKIIYSVITFWRKVICKPIYRIPDQLFSTKFNVCESSLRGKSEKSRSYASSSNLGNYLPPYSPLLLSRAVQFLPVSNKCFCCFYTMVRKMFSWGMKACFYSLGYAVYLMTEPPKQYFIEAKGVECTRSSHHAEAKQVWIWPMLSWKMSGTPMFVALISIVEQMQDTNKINQYYLLKYNVIIH